MQLVTSLILEEFSPGFRNLMALLEHTGEVISEKATTFTAVSGVPAFQRNFGALASTGFIIFCKSLVNS